MEIFLFVSRFHLGIRALTVDPTGGNLPQDYAPWHSMGQRSKPRGRPMIEPINDIVESNGFFLLSGRRKAKRNAE
jgi:hypothetical protein